MRRHGGIWTCVALLTAWLAAGVAVAEPILAEKMLPADAVAAVFVRDGATLSAQWKTTALHELLQDPEMKEMVAPLKATVAGFLTVAKAQAPGVDPGALLSSEIGLALVVRAQPGVEPTAAVQLVARPKDPAVLARTVDAALQMLVQAEKGALRDGPDGTRILVTADEDTQIILSIADGLLVATLAGARDAAAPALHQETLARRALATGGLLSDPEYILVRGKVGDDALFWGYLGIFPWMERNAQLTAPAKPFLEAAGLDKTKGVAFGTAIVDRGFRTRLFVHTAVAPAAQKPITAQDLAVVPSDVVAFSMGTTDWIGLYDRLTGMIRMIPDVNQQQKILQGIVQVENIIGMPLREDVFGALAGPVVFYVTESGSPVGRAPHAYAKVRDPKQAAARLTAILNVAAGLVQQVTGPHGQGLVQLRTIERARFTQIYPQSVLPGMVTPNFVISETGWAGLNFSARAAMSKMDYFLNHPVDVTARPDFAAAIARMPKTYTAISYNDTRANFANGLSLAQFVADVAAGALKIKLVADKGGEPFPVASKDLWSFDPGRFPSDKLLQEKLFGAVSVWAPTADGLLWENFSPVGPIPMPALGAGIQGPQSVASVSILAGLLLPALARARGAAREANCKENLSQMLKAIYAYTTNNEDMTPSSLADLMPQYIANGRVFVCPQDDNPVPLKNGAMTSYRYIGRVPPRGVWSDLIVLYDRQPLHQGGMRNVGHYDGHVRAYNLEELNQKLAEQYEKFKPIMDAPNFPGDVERVKAFFEDRDFEDK